MLLDAEDQLVARLTPEQTELFQEYQKVLFRELADAALRIDGVLALMHLDMPRCYAVMRYSLSEARDTVWEVIGCKRHS